MNSNKELTDIERAQKSDPFINSRIQYLTNKELPDNKKEAWEILVDIEKYFLDDSRILYHIFEPVKATSEGVYKQLVLPPKFRSDMIYWAHDHPIGSHFGLKKTLNKIQKKYYWPRMFTDID